MRRPPPARRALAPDGTTIRAMLDARVRTARGAPAVFAAAGRRWRASSLEDLLREADRVAAALAASGFAAGERIAILCRTRVEWLIAELGAMSAGLVVVGIDAHAAPAQIAHLLRDSGAAALIAESNEALARIGPAPLHALRLIVSIDGGADAPDTAAPMQRWNEWVRAAPPLVGAATAASAVGPDAPATLLYTSGTTGQPRGIEYRHKHLAVACRAILEEFPGLARRGATTICWLPMAALFQRMMNYVALASGVRIYFVEDPAAIVAAARRIRPTYFIGVPRFFEKLYQAIHERLATRPRRARRLVELALAHSPRAPGMRRRRVVLRARLLDVLVLRRLRRVLGGRLRFMITGSAPAPVWMLEYFHRIGILLLEAYGLSEDTVPVAANRPEAYRFGSVGKPFAANDVRLSQEGEILVRGPGLFEGYFHDRTARDAGLLDDDGFYRTGDLGRIDADGFLFITGRKSEVFKTSTGRWIAPARIEAVYKKVPYVEQVVVVGRGRPYPVALLWINDALLPGGDTGARLRRDLDAAATGLAEYERIRRFEVLNEPLALERGELTATLKLRRDVIEQRYAAVIDALYAGTS